jgi:site-specific recombinase XerD
VSPKLLTKHAASASSGALVRDLVKAFLRSLKNADTRRAYRSHLENAVTTMRIRVSAEILPARLARFHAVVLNSDLSSTRQAQGLSALRSFLGWCALRGAIPHLPIDTARRILRLPQVNPTVRVPEILDHDDLAALFANADVETGSRAMLAVFLGAGLRGCELSALEVGDVLAAGAGKNHIRVRRRREGCRLVPVHNPVVSAIKVYLRATDRELGRGTGRVFIAHDPGAQGRSRAGISTRSVRRRITKLLRSAGVTKRSGVQGLRHKFAFAMLEDGATLKEIANILGHVSITTTHKYIDHLDPDRLRAAVPRLVPAARSRTAR